ncbi:helix-turn-helix transcriptional regulator [Microbacterium sp. H1-D42]|uniref:helix-turn-helix transcriptional regulator n=1 Tax=Microbacterium sp. H1-D42 TaxID=2925844 RepID=UPI001F5359D5|nr:helix-turn-helix transcriptional regulator [Microbacterium sp. H1-D42]UNK71562.1 helix-turn-helix transcriptional regulator [Microbacterium sp. H1-D42]
MDAVELTDRLEALLRSARASGETSATGLDVTREQPDEPPLGEAIATHTDMNQLFSSLQLSATHSVDALDNGDYCAETRGQSPSQTVALATGVRYRVVYSTGIFDQDAHLEATLSAIAQGEDARVFDHVPSRVLIRDGQEVLVIASGYPDAEQLGFHSAHPAVVSYFCEMFDMVWTRAIPVTERRPDIVGILTGDQIQLLRYLVLGRTDASIARSLGVSTRTVQRQIQTIQLRLGARGRFQLGLLVSRFFPSLGNDSQPQTHVEAPAR